MAEILRAVDRCERMVVLHDSRWDHICEEHREMHGHEASVRRTLHYPEVHTRDDVFANREVFYKKGVLPPPDSNDYVKVVVEYREADNGDVVGRVITSYATSKVKQGEELIWQTP